MDRAGVARRRPGPHLGHGVVSGFRLPEAQYTVDFSGTSLAGLEIVLREMSTGDVLELGALAAAFGDEDNPGDVDPDDIRNLLTRFIRFIRSWNLVTADGTPEPVAVDTLMRYPLGRFVLPVLNRCITAINSMDGELGKGSGPGSPSALESIPTAALS